MIETAAKATLRGTLLEGMSAFAIFESVVFAGDEM